MQHFLQSIAVRPLVALLIVVFAAACSSTTSPNVTTPAALPAAETPSAAAPGTEFTAAPGTNATDSGTGSYGPTAVTESAPPVEVAAATETVAPTDAAAPTQTASPTDTPAPTEASSPTETPASQPGASTVGAAGLSGWCLPTDVSVSRLQNPLDPPATARVGEIVNGALEIHNLPTSACVFLYTFDQTAPTGLTLQVYEERAQKPWLTADLAPLEGKPETLAATLRHTYIAAPPLWDVSYQFVVADASGKELRRDQVNLHRWKPALCWNGRLPNVLTLRCPLPQDLHPWDPSYGTPIPTFPPEDD